MRARRRQDEARMKARARRILARWYDGRPFSPRNVGVVASTHGRPCSCMFCARDAAAIPPPRERRYLDLDVDGQGA